ncbi:Hect e3 ubiquitin, partial [Globisporangium splendens]
MSPPRSNSYGTLGYAYEDDAFLGPSDVPRRSAGSLRAWGKIAISAVISLAGVGYCVNVQSSLQAQQEMIALMQGQLQAMHSAVVQSAAVQSRATISNSAHSHFSPSSLSSKLPPKFHVKHVTPLKTQDNRGTCWDFATIGTLEQSYRAQGIQNGWLKPDEYVALSEQAYGAEVLRLCSGPPGSPQQVACLIPGNQIWKNSTEGGESGELFYLMNGLKDSIFPDAVCPYIPDDGNDTLCEGLTPEKRKTNPLKLTIRKMDTYYDELAVKRALLRDGNAMAFTTATPYATYFYPCVGEFLNDPRCNPASPKCTLCPAEMPQTTCCIPITGRESYNMDGEFITTPSMMPEGGHVMTLVGYNDLYRTTQGYTGGFILKNSWWDGTHPKLGPTHARGSHTAKWWMQEVSDWEERRMCPNSHNPENWYQCGDFGEVILRNGDSGVKVPLPLSRSEVGEFKEGIESCLSEETELYAKTNFQPLHLRCTDPSYCLEDKNITYFARNMTEYGDRMQILCLYEYNTVSKNASEICLPPLLVQQIAYVLSPVDDEILPNDPDVCGHYFYPYEVQKQYNSQFGNFYVNNFEVKWYPQSYVSNERHFPELDYTDIMHSTRHQNHYDFVGPFPFARVVAGKDLPKVDELQLPSSDDLCRSAKPCAKLRITRTKNDMGVPAKDTRFLRKLYLLLGTEDASIISWSDDGSAFSIYDPAALQKLMKAKYNLSSMCTFRQNLRAFGFTELNQSPRTPHSAQDRLMCAVPETYRHKFFVRGHPADLEKIDFDASAKFRCHKCRRRPNEAGTKCFTYTAVSTHPSSKTTNSPTRADILPDTAVLRAASSCTRIAATVPFPENRSSSVRHVSPVPVNQRVSPTECERGSLQVQFLLGSIQMKSLPEDEAHVKIIASMKERKRPVDCSVDESKAKRMRVMSNPEADANLTAHAMLQPTAQRTLSSARPSIAIPPFSRELLPQRELTNYLETTQSIRNRGIGMLPPLVDVLSAIVY